MIPDFNQHGLLPRGIHKASMEEFKERFVIFDQSDRRFRIFQGLNKLVEEATKAEMVKRVLIAGSYITSKAEPNDFDCLIVLDESIIERQLLPFEYRLLSRRMAKKAFDGDVLAVIDGSSAERRLLDFFQTTRDGFQAGVVEIEL